MAAAMVLVSVGPLARAQSDAGGVRGGVVNHEGTPPAEGAVTLQSLDRSSLLTAPLDQSGRFQIIPNVAGRYRLTIVVPGYAPRLADVIVPASRTIVLPPLLLEPAAYFRVRFVNSEGEVIVSPVIRRRTVGADGVSFPVADGSTRIDSDGSVTIGPLANGVTTMALDMPGLAQTRLPDVSANGAHGTQDGGTIVIPPGTVVRVDVVTLDGTPVANHQVAIEDVRPNSPLAFQPVRTDDAGRATFGRVGAGRYRVSTSMLDGCNGHGVRFSAEQLVTVKGTGEIGVRIVVGGQAALRVTSPLGLLSGSLVSVAPETTARRIIAMPGTPPIVPAPPSCGGTTDGDGRATFTHMPRGSARVSVRLHNSTFERRVDLRGDSREIAIAVPDGAIQLRAIDAVSGRGVPRAAVTWNGGGNRVLAVSTGNGDILLEGVGDEPGLLAVTAPGFLEAKTEVPALPAAFDVALTPEPSSIRSVRVVSDTGEPIAQAIVLLAPQTVFDIGVYAATDRNGVVRFTNVPPREARVVAQADGFVGAALNLPGDSDAPATLTLTRARR